MRRMREMIRGPRRVVVGTTRTMFERALRVTRRAWVQQRDMCGGRHLAQQREHCNQPTATSHPPHEPSVPFSGDHGSVRAPGFMIRSTGRPPTFFSGKNTL